MLNNLLMLYNKQSHFDKINYLFIFLLPLFAVSIRHWASGMASMIFILSVIYYFLNRKNYKPFKKEEKYFIYIILFYFIIYLLSSVVNGWGKPQSHILGTMLHFIAIIPMFYMFRHLKFSLIVLTAGSILASISNIIYLYYSSSPGIYSHLFTGPMAVIFCVFIVAVVVNIKINKIFRMLLLIVLILSILSVFNLGSRSAYIAIILLMVFYLFVYLNGKNRAFAAFFILIASVGSYYGNTNVHMRIDRILHGISEYYNEPNPAQATEKFNKVHDIAARFEMWRAAKYFVPENLFLGFGPNEYENKIQILVENKLISSVAQASHPHNAYFMELYSKGIFGLIAMLLVLYYPAYIFIKYYKVRPYESILGLSLIISFTAFSLTESATFNNNNFSSMMLIYISIVFVSVFQQKNNLTSSNHG